MNRPVGIFVDAETLKELKNIVDKIFTEKCAYCGREKGSIYVGCADPKSHVDYIITSDSPQRTDK